MHLCLRILRPETWKRFVSIVWIDLNLYTSFILYVKCRNESRPHKRHTFTQSVLGRVLSKTSWKNAWRGAIFRMCERVSLFFCRREMIWFFDAFCIVFFHCSGSIRSPLRCRGTTMPSRRCWRTLVPELCWFPHWSNWSISHSEGHITTIVYYCSKGLESIEQIVKSQS